MIQYHRDLIQGSDEWIAARCGLLTASEMKLIVTPTMRGARNDKERAHLYELLAQRVTRYVEPVYVNDDMLRGQEDEIEARALYQKNYNPVEQVGFVTNDKWGFTLGYSPDGLVWPDGLIECKSRRQKYQVEVWIDGEIPTEHVVQVQTGLLVAEREWCDYISYSGGLPMAVIRAYADRKMQQAIIDAAASFEERLRQKMAEYEAALAAAPILLETKRRVIEEIVL